MTPWTVSQIIKQVSGRTENRAANKPNLDIRMEFFLALDEMVQEQHYWWRRKMFSFATIIGKQTYDLSAAAPDANVPDLVEIEEIFVVNSSPQCWPYSVPPEFDARQQVGSVYGLQTVGQLIPRGGYFLTLGQFQQMTLSQPPNMVYTVAGTYYAVPMVTDPSTDAIPLVPPNLHWGLAYMLERRIYEYLYGQEDPRFTMANARYEQFKLSAAKYKSFSQQQAVHASVSGGAVHANGGRGRTRG